MDEEIIDLKKFDYWIIYRKIYEDKLIIARSNNRDEIVKLDEELHETNDSKYKPLYNILIKDTLKKLI